jgi:hypothetical protein
MSFQVTATATRRGRRYRRPFLARAVAEALEGRRLLAAPLLLEPIPREQRGDYIASDPSLDLGPVSRFEWEYSAPRLVYRFDQPVDVQRQHLVVTRLNDGGEVPADNVLANAVGFDGTETFTFANGVMVPAALETGNYEALLRGGANGPANAAGERLAGENITEFYVFHGDINRDRVIDGADYGTIDNSAQFPGAAGYFNGDMNYDGTIDGADYGILDNEIQMYNGVDLPPPPRGANELNAYASMGRGRIDVDWSPPADMTNVDGFRIFRSADSVNYTLHAQVADPNATNWHEEGLLDGQKFYYRVRAYNEHGNAITTNEDYGVTGIPQPSGVTVSAVTPSTATLHWSDNSNGEDGFEILRRGADGQYEVIATAPAYPGEGARSLELTGLVPDTEYAYRVRAFTGPAATKTQSSFDSAPVEFATPIPGKLAAPVQLTATAVESDRIDLTWDDASEGESGFIIARRATGGEWITIGTVAAGVTSYSDTSAVGGTTYSYAAYAKGSAGGAGGSSASKMTKLTAQTSGGGANFMEMAEAGQGQTSSGVQVQWSEPVMADGMRKQFGANKTISVTATGLPKHDVIYPTFSLEWYTGPLDNLTFKVDGEVRPDWGYTPHSSLTYMHPQPVEHTGSSVTIEVEVGDYGDGSETWQIWTAGVSWGLQDVWISGASGLGEPSHDGSFTVTRSAATPKALPVEVTYNGYGSANQSDYYLPPNTVTIPADESSITVPLRVRDDSVVEGEESFFVELHESDKYRVSDDARWAEVGIGDDDGSSGGTGPGGTGFGGGGGPGGGGPPIVYDPPIEPPPPDDDDDEPPPDDDPTTVNNSVRISGGEGGSTKDGDGEMAVEDAQWVRLNDDFDKDENADDGSPQRDNEITEWIDDRPDNELFSLGASFATDDPEFDAATDESTIAFEFGGNVRLWRPADDPNVGPDCVPVTSGEEFDVGLAKALYFESWSGGFSVMVDPIAASSAAGDVEITAVYTRNGDTVRDTMRITIGSFDVDVDSDNTKGAEEPERDAQEDYLEERNFSEGLFPTRYDQKIVPTNDDDSDGDGVAGTQDGWDQDQLSTLPETLKDNHSAKDKFTPVVMDFNPDIDTQAAKVVIFYEDHDPLHPPTPPGGQFPSGRIRLWKEPGDIQRDAKAVADDGDYVKPGVPYQLSQLDGGVISASGVLPLYVEGIVPSKEKGDVHVTMYVDPDGDGEKLGYTMADSVLLTVVNVDVMIGANDAHDRSSADDWIGAAGDGRTHSILNFLRLDGPPDLEMDFSVTRGAGGGGGVTLTAFNVNDDGEDVEGPATGTLDTDRHTGPFGGADWGEFFIEGGSVSGAPEDVRIEAKYGSQVFGSETMSVVRFSAESESYGKSDIPVNPAAVSARAVHWGGNVFGADVAAADQTLQGNPNPYKSDTPWTLPDLTSSRKISYGNIEVTWGREHGTTKVRSGTFGSSLQPPLDNGTSPTVADRLRIQDFGITPAMEAVGGTVRYVLGHPTEASKAELDMFTNSAAEIGAKVLTPKTYPTFLNLMQLTNANGVVLGDVFVSANDATEIFTAANKILSQAGIELQMPPASAPATTTDPTYFDVTGLASTTGSVDNLIFDYKSAVVDIFIVRSIYDGTTPLTGTTIYPGMSTGWNKDAPGIVLAAGTRTTATTRQLKNYEIGRTLGHEFLHYVMKWDDTKHAELVPPYKKWNLFASGDGGYPAKRDIDDDQLQRILGVNLSTTNPDQ